MKTVVYSLFILLFLSGCGTVTTESGPSVNVGLARVSLHVNNQGQFVVNGQISIPIVLGIIDWDVAFNDVLNNSSDKSNYLIVLSQDENRNVTENDYPIGQPFQIDFEQDQWVRRISHQTNGAIIVFVDKQAMMGQTASTMQPADTTVSNNPSSAEEEHYSDPGDFARWYFTAVWQDRNYDYLWTLCTPAFQNAASTGGYSEFTSWWGSVNKVDISSVSVSQNDGHYATIHVVVTFEMQDGSVMSNKAYDYDLIFDSNRQTWMFDYR